MRKANFAIVDAECKVLNIDVVAFGRAVTLAAIFCCEEDALHVASRAEGLTGTVHAIIPLQNRYTVERGPQRMEVAARV